MLITCWRLQLRVRLHVRWDGHVLSAWHLMCPRHILLTRRMLWDWHVLQPWRLRRSAGRWAASWPLRCCEAAAREERRGRPPEWLRLMRHRWRPLP